MNIAKTFEEFAGIIRELEAIQKHTTYRDDAARLALIVPPFKILGENVIAGNDEVDIDALFDMAEAMLKAHQVVLGRFMIDLPGGGSVAPITLDLPNYVVLNAEDKRLPLYEVVQELIAVRQQHVDHGAVFSTGYRYNVHYKKVEHIPGKSFGAGATRRVGTEVHTSHCAHLIDAFSVAMQMTGCEIVDIQRTI